eukprot:PhM_4_TR14129/c1_g2_i8/m.90808
MATCASNGMWLATIPTAADWHNAKLAVPCGGSAWLGGSDERQEGTWVWDDGPDKGTVFYEHGSRRCYSGTCPWGTCDNVQPDNYGSGGQDHLYLAYDCQLDMRWDDLQSSNTDNNSNHYAALCASHVDPNIVYVPRDRSSSSSSSRSQVWVVVGAVVGGCAMALVVALTCFWYNKRSAPSPPPPPPPPRPSSSPAEEQQHPPDEQDGVVTVEMA